jgi:hypothetical protein
VRKRRPDHRRHHDDGTTDDLRNIEERHVNLDQYVDFDDGNDRPVDIGADLGTSR